jgi:hypothetical protein
MVADYTNMIQRAILPEIMDTVYRPSIEPMIQLFGKDPNIPVGDVITMKARTGWTSNAAAQVKGIPDPVSSTQVTVRPFWTKTFFHATAEVEGIDLSNAQGSGDNAVYNLVQDAITAETKALMQVVLAAQIAQIEADVHSNAWTYSTAAINRVVNPTLASFLEANAVANSLALMRGLFFNSMTLKNCGPKSGYVCLCDETPYQTLKPLVNALHNFPIPQNDPIVSMGFREVTRFEDVDIVVPQGTTVGTILYLRKEDVKIFEHRPLEIEQKPAPGDTLRFVLKIGMNSIVKNPGFQGKMTNKT